MRVNEQPVPGIAGPRYVKRQSMDLAFQGAELVAEGENLRSQVRHGTGSRLPGAKPRTGQGPGLAGRDTCQSGLPTLRSSTRS